MKRTMPVMHDATVQGTCECWPDRPGIQCGKPAVFRYPAMGGGYCRLCARHSEKHAEDCGRWDGQRWSASKWERHASEEMTP